MVPTPQQIIHTAKELHKCYRAAAKALDTNCLSKHDHGWEGCHRKTYFMYRAVRLLRTMPVGGQLRRDRRPVSKGTPNPCDIAGGLA